MSSRTAIIVFKRLLSSSINVRASAAAAQAYSRSAAASSSAGGTTPDRTAESLGFERRERTRILPDLKIDFPASAKRSVDFSQDGYRSSQRQPRREGTNANRPNNQRPSRPRRDSDQSQRSQPQSAAPNTQESTNTDAIPSAIEPDFFENADILPSTSSSSRSAAINSISISTDDLTSTTTQSFSRRGGSGSRSSSGRGRGDGQRQRDRSSASSDTGHRSAPSDQRIRSASRRGERKSNREGNVRVKAVESVHMATRPAMPPVVGDKSPRALFGPKSILNPVVRGAREAESSFWAAGMDPSTARKTDVLRLAGSYAIFLPTTPLTLPGETTPAEKAKSDAAWTLAMNRSIGMRKSAAAADVIKGYLG